MRDPFNFGFNDLNHDGKIDAGERAYGFSILNSMSQGKGRCEDDDDFEDEEEDEDTDFGDDDSDEEDNHDSLGKSFDTRTGIMRFYDDNDDRKDADDEEDDEDSDSDDNLWGGSDDSDF